MSEIRVSMSKELKDRVKKISDYFGVSESEYVRGLIITDVKKNVMNNEK